MKANDIMVEEEDVLGKLLVSIATAVLSHVLLLSMPIFFVMLE